MLPRKTQIYSYRKCKSNPRPTPGQPPANPRANPWPTPGQPPALLFKRRILSYGRQNYNSHCESAALCCWKKASIIVFLRNDQVFVWEKKILIILQRFDEKNPNQSPKENRKKETAQICHNDRKKKGIRICEFCDWYIQLLILFILLLKLFTLLFKNVKLVNSGNTSQDYSSLTEIYLHF